MRIRIGSRESTLARWQATFIANQLSSVGHEVEFVWITTEGDQSATTSVPLTQSHGVGVFTKAIQRALLENRCDVAVHSLKDLPTAYVPGLAVVATTRREDARDSMLSLRFRSFDELPHGASIGTGSPRRIAQVLRLRPDLICKPIRGNIDTRIRKMHSGEYDAILLASAGLHRLGLENQIVEYFDTDRMLPAVGQAALGIECREDDVSTRDALATLNHAPSWAAVTAERSVLRQLQAGCLAPMGSYAILAGQILHLRARLLSADGSHFLQAEVASNIGENCDPTLSDRLGRIAAEQLLRAGAEALL